MPHKFSRAKRFIPEFLFGQDLSALSPKHLIELKIHSWRFLFWSSSTGGSLDHARGRTNGQSSNDETWQRPGFIKLWYKKQAYMSKQRIKDQDLNLETFLAQTLQLLASFKSHKAIILVLLAAQQHLRYALLCSGTIGNLNFPSSFQEVWSNGTMSSDPVPVQCTVVVRNILIFFFVYKKRTWAMTLKNWQ